MVDVQITLGGQLTAYFGPWTLGWNRISCRAEVGKSAWIGIFIYPAVPRKYEPDKIHTCSED